MGMTKTLSGLRVLETGDSIAASYAGKLLRDLGAVVVREERVPGDSIAAPEPVRRYRQVLGEFLHKGKDLIPRLEAGRRSAGFDLILSTDPLERLREEGLDPDRLADAGQVLVSITNRGLGEDDSQSLMPDLLASALGGFLLLTGLPDRPPVRNQVSLPQFQAGIFGVIGALGALCGREMDGGGDVVDVSLYESVAFLMEREDLVYTHQHTLWTRSARHKIVHPFTILPCGDGYVSLAVASPMQFRSLAELIEHPQLADDESILLNTIGNADLIDQSLLPWLAAHGKWEVATLLQERRIPATPVLGFNELLEDAQMAARRFFHAESTSEGSIIVPGMPYKMHAQEMPQ
jgi:crotonobetainyl-CoA:carnitine CoA-transferase CaiB-like acyl-CoA transferase